MPEELVKGHRKGALLNSKRSDRLRSVISIHIGDMRPLVTSLPLPANRTSNALTPSKPKLMFPSVPGMLTVVREAECLALA